MCFMLHPILDFAPALASSNYFSGIIRNVQRFNCDNFKTKKLCTFRPEFFAGLLGCWGLLFLSGMKETPQGVRPAPA